MAGFMNPVRPRIIEVIQGRCDNRDCVVCPAEPEPTRELLYGRHGYAALELAIEVCVWRDGDSHCAHWWDAEPCCSCGTDIGAKGDVDEERARAQ